MTLLAGVVPLFAVESNDELLKLARDGNHAAIRSIKTMECHIDRVPLTVSKERAQHAFRMVEINFWRSAERYRTEVKDQIDAGGNSDSLFRNGRLLTYTPHPPQLCLMTPPPVVGSGGEVWTFLLFSHWSREVAFHTLDEILIQKQRSITAKRDPITKEIIIRIENEGLHFLELWLDPKVNYLVRKSVMVPIGDRTMRHENVVATFAEPSPGVFVPTVIDHHFFHRAEPVISVQTRVTDLKVNHDLPESAIRIPGIEGLECLDSDLSIRFTVDADGRRVGPIHKEDPSIGHPSLAPQSVPASAIVSFDPSVLPSEYRTTSSFPLKSWLFLGVIVMTVGLSSWFFFRKPHRKRTH